MSRGIRIVGALTLVCAISGIAARAQYGYPPGYGAYGWGGWGGSGGGGTVQGDVARGMGVLAAGAGQYNEQTAQARAVNAETARRWNQYMWQSQQEANRRYAAKSARGQQDNARARDEIARRLRDDPTPADIMRGDALNAALDELSNPNVYIRSLKGASIPLAGTTIRDIPFQKAAAAITTSVAQLIQGGPPPVLKTAAFDDDRAALRAIGQEVRRQGEDQGKIDPALLQQARDRIMAIKAKVDASIPKNTPDRRAAENYLKALFGLTRMLETPAINILMAGVEKRPDTTVGDLLGFMSAYNLRFGVATTPRQQEVYGALYPILVKLRNEVRAAIAGTPAPPVDAPVAHPEEFFSGLDFEHLGAGKTPAAP